MRIPPQAIIAPEKLTRYLLVPKPRNDKSRYLARAGFSLSNPAALEQAIRNLASSVDAAQGASDEYGTRYTVTGDLVGPSGTRLPVVLAWVRRHDGEFHLITVVPNPEPSS